MAHITAGSKSLSLPFSVWNAGITGVTGTLAKGSTLTIAGRDFGNGPDFANCLYDGCDGTGTRTVNDPAVGVWDEVSNADGTQKYEAGGRDGANCVRVLEYDPVGRDIKNFICRLTFTNKTKVYMSFWYKQVANTFWPSNLITGRDTFDGADSSAKLAWLQYDDRPDFFGTATNDLILVSYAPGFSVRGNNTGETFTVGEITSNWWGFGDWVKISGYFTVDPNDRTNPTPQSLDIMNPNIPLERVQVQKERAVLENSEPTAPLAWNKIEPFGFYRGGDITGANAVDDVRHQMDDFYIALGDNAPARIELGDNADYDLCTELTNCYPANASWWQDSQIQVVVEQGGLNLAGDVWLFVTHSDDKRRMSFKVN